MPVVQRIGFHQLAPDQPGSSSDVEALRRAKLVVAAMAARNDADAVAPAREVLQALGLLSLMAPQGVSS